MLQVVNTRLACKLHELLPKADSGDAKSLSELERFAHCMKHILLLLPRQSPQHTKYFQAARRMLEDLQQSAGKVSHPGVQGIVQSIGLRWCPQKCVKGVLPDCQPQGVPREKHSLLHMSQRPASERVQYAEMPSAENLGTDLCAAPETRHAGTDSSRHVVLINRAHSAEKNQALGMELEEI